MLEAQNTENPFIPLKILAIANMIVIHISNTHTHTHKPKK